MYPAQTQPTRLSTLQLELLKIFAHNPDEQELRDIKQLLAEYYARKAHAAMDDFLLETGANAEEFYRTVSEEHLRTPYISTNQQ
jgi:hypothetical protein